MNGYEKHSKDYGGPPPGWGTVALIVIIVGGLVGLVVSRLL
jgi:hypothetical protein